MISKTNILKRIAWLDFQKFILEHGYTSFTRFCLFLFVSFQYNISELPIVTAP